MSRRFKPEVVDMINEFIDGIETRALEAEGPVDLNGTDFAILRQIAKISLDPMYARHIEGINAKKVGSLGGAPTAEGTVSFLTYGGHTYKHVEQTL